jgi:hypothetical protein
MGCDGGYRLFKLAEMKRPEILRRIQNWFIVNTFENPDAGSHGDWFLVELHRSPRDNKRGDYESVTVTLQDWLQRHGFNRVEDIPAEFIFNRGGIYSSILTTSELPLTEDLVRLSYGTNVPDEYDNLGTIIARGNEWFAFEGKVCYFEDCNEYYSADERPPWSFCEETWT